MTYILRRKSVILLICIFFAGFIALMSGHPSDVVGAPFANCVVEQASALLGIFCGE